MRGGKCRGKGSIGGRLYKPLGAIGGGPLGGRVTSPKWLAYPLK